MAGVCGLAGSRQVAKDTVDRLGDTLKLVARASLGKKKLDFVAMCSILRMIEVMAKPAIRYPCIHS